MKKKLLNWNRLFLFCLGLFVASTFAMKWIESDLLYNQEVISIFGLELFYPAGKIEEIFSGIPPLVKTILSYHLHFDFIFMAGCFPGIACLCMIAAGKTDNRFQKSALISLAFLQPVAWAFDLMENYYLLKWLNHPVIGDEFGFYRVVVYSKWAIALSAALMALTLISTSALKRRILKQ